jgi:hypothetical protein
VPPVPGKDELDEIARFEIQEGWDVLDADGESIGTVDWFATRASRCAPVGSMDIAFTDVESADIGHVTLSLSGEELTSDLEPRGGAVSAPSDPENPIGAD